MVMARLVVVAAAAAAAAAAVMGRGGGGLGLSAVTAAAHMRLLEVHTWATDPSLARAAIRFRVRSC